MNEEKGITLIVLILTILVLVIVTSLLALNSFNSIEMSTIAKLNTDIRILEDRVAAYYAKNNTLPTRGELVQKSYVKELVNDLNTNDGDRYYAIDLSKLDNPTLYYGNNYEDSSDDKYIINEETHQIYYLNGIMYDGKIYHTTESYDTDFSESIPAIPQRPQDGLEEYFKNNTKVQYVINYPVDIDGDEETKDDWQVFYIEDYNGEDNAQPGNQPDEGRRVFLIASDYVKILDDPNSAIRKSMKNSCMIASTEDNKKEYVLA